MGLYSGGLIIRRIFVSEIRGGGGGRPIFGTWEGLSGVDPVIFDRGGANFTQRHCASHSIASVSLIV